MRVGSISAAPRLREASNGQGSLQVSPDRLAEALQQQVGKPTKRVILERILLEARRYLQFTDLSAKEIAARLGYRDPFHFSRVFKQSVGLSPSDYRRRWPAK